MTATATGVLKGHKITIYADPKKSVTNVFVCDEHNKVLYGRTVATTDVVEATDVVIKKLERC